MSRMLRAFQENERGIKRLLSRFFTRAEDVDDIAQETFLRAFAAEADQDVRAPRAFLYRIARNLALNEKARLASTTTDYMEDSSHPDVLGSSDQVTGEDQVYSRQKMAIFAEAVSSLPAQCRHVFLLRKVHGLSQNEVAVRLGISPSTVEKHVASGLLRTAEYLRERGYDAGPSRGARPATGEGAVPTVADVRSSDGLRVRRGGTGDV